jgi:hypothetical protein
MKVLDSTEFIDMLDLGICDDMNSLVNFNDEIVDIEYIGEEITYDIDVTGNHLYYANGILTHNSAVNNLESTNDAVSDSIGTVMTADFMLFLLQDEAMKEQNEIVCKVTKNRLAGRTDTWMMNIDYEHMRFSDAIVPTDINIDIALGNSVSEVKRIAAEKQKDMEDFANTEVKAIVQEDMDKMMQQDTSDPFNDDMDEMFKDLGIKA